MKNYTQLFNCSSEIIFYHSCYDRNIQHNILPKDMDNAAKNKYMVEASYYFLNNPVLFFPHIFLKKIVTAGVQGLLFSVLLTKYDQLMLVK